MHKILFSFLLLMPFVSKSQTSHQLPTKEVRVIPYWGTIVCGYVDQGAFVNFTGPALGYVFGKSQILVGMLPSLRIKEDSGTTTKNSMITPTLGVGITYTYKSIAFQIPLYYSSKTSTTNGHWNVGLGVGMKLSAIFSSIRFKKDS
jgi:hypothetical protein